MSFRSNTYPSSRKNLQLHSEGSNWSVVKRLLKLSWEYRAQCIKILILQLILLTLGLSGLGLTGLGIDVVRFEVDSSAQPPAWPFGMEPSFLSDPFHQVTAIALLILLFATLRGVLNYFYLVAVAYLVQKEIVVRLRTQIFDKLQRLSFRFFDENNSGSIINRVTGDAQQVRMFVDQVLMKSIIMVLSLVVYLSYMLTLHVPLTLACLATIPLLWISSILFSRAVKPEYRKNRKLVDDMILSLSENIKGIQVTKGFGREEHQMDQFRKANQKVKDQQQILFWKVSTFVPATEFLAHVNLFILLVYGGYLVIEGQLPLGTGLVVFAGLLQQFSSQIMMLANITNSAQVSLTAARRVFEVLDAPIEVENASSPRVLDSVKGEIEFKGVEFEYQEVEPVLRDINFIVKPGECVALTGPTGSGKSALISLIPRFYDVTKGGVCLDGIDVRQIELGSLRQQVAMVFQENFLFSRSIAENIAFGHPKATQEQIEKAARIASAHDFILELPDGYNSVLKENGADLSGGQRQRLAIARAMLLNPSILILDDPTAAVDAKTEHEVLDAMEKAIEGRTTFIVAHRFNTLKRVDRILVLDQGRIVQVGNHSQLIEERGPYRRMMALQRKEERDKK